MGLQFGTETKMDDIAKLSNQMSRAVSLHFFKFSIGFGHLGFCFHLRRHRGFCYHHDHRGCYFHHGHRDYYHDCRDCFHDFGSSDVILRNISKIAYFGNIISTYLCSFHSLNVFIFNHINDFVWNTKIFNC